LTLGASRKHVADGEGTYGQWREAAARGRRAVVLASTEGKTVVLDGYYQALLGSPATPAELGALVPAVRAGLRDEQVIASIVGSQEYLGQIP